MKNKKILTTAIIFKKAKKKSSSNKKQKNKIYIYKTKMTANVLKEGLNTEKVVK